ncbi:MAG: V-type ATP synthase subunit F [Clostridiales bacterium]
MYKIAIVGDKDSITIYKAAGLDIFPTNNVQEIKSKINKLADESYGIIFIIEDFMKDLSESIERYKEAITPIIISIPGVKGSKGTGISQLKNAMERAIGVDVLFRDK